MCSDCTGAEDRYLSSDIIECGPSHWYIVIGNNADGSQVCVSSGCKCGNDDHYFTATTYRKDWISNA